MGSAQHWSGFERQQEPRFKLGGDHGHEDVVGPGPVKTVGVFTHRILTATLRKTSWSLPLYRPRDPGSDREAQHPLRSV